MPVPTASSAHAKAPAWSAAAAPGPSGSVVFGAGSEFARRVDRAPLAANSPRVAGVFGASAAKLPPGVNFDRWGIAFYQVTGETRELSVDFADCFNSGQRPAQFLEPMSAVPIPGGAQPAPGTDGHMAIFDAASRTLWEMWRPSWTDGQGWRACWGGRIEHTDTAPGYFAGGTGAAATGLSLAGAMVTIAEARAGVIRHAVGITVPASAKGRFSYPAQRTDGVVNSDQVPYEGQRFRLDPALRVDTLGLHPLAAAIAVAAQRYGFIVVDRSDAVGITCESGLPTKLLTGTDPWPGIVRAGQYDILHRFPWEKLQALPVNWGKP